MTTFLLVLVLVTFGICECFVGVNTLQAYKRNSGLFSATLLEKDATYTSSFQIIDECAVAGVPSDDLYDAVRYIDRNASKLYPDEAAKEEMWKRGYGSWKLQLATGPPARGGVTPFKTVPIFAYAMIDENNFGNGVGFNQDTIILSLLGPHYFNTKRRVMGIGIEDMFLFSNKVTQFVPEFISKGMGLKKKPADFSGKKGSRMPAFTIIGSSEKSLIARGGSGGIAIWTRLDKDIKPAAYGVE